MRMKTLVVFCILQVVVFCGMAFGWGLDSVKSASSGGGSGSLTKADIDSYFALSKKADDLKDGSINALDKILRNQDDVAKTERDLSAANEIKDPKEKEAAVNKVKADQQASIEKAANDKNAQQKLASLSKDQKKQASASISNLFLAALTSKSAVEVAKGVVQKAQASPVSAAGFATEIPKIKDGLSAIPTKIEKMYTLANQLMKVAKGSSVEVTIPKSAADKPQEISL